MIIKPKTRINKNGIIDTKLYKIPGMQSSELYLYSFLDVYWPKKRKARDANFVNQPG